MNMIKYALLQTFAQMLIDAETFGKCQVVWFLQSVGRTIFLTPQSKADPLERISLFLHGDESTKKTIEK